jgi:asparagine synthase (glutamine-hydrolysing)
MCADEIFGGYPWYRDKELRERFGFPWSQSTLFRKTFFSQDFAYLKNDAENYVNERYMQTIRQADTSHTSLLADKININDKNEKRMKELVNLNMKWFMQTLLERQNKLSGGLKMRAPFCDYRIAEYLYNVPWEYKDYNNTEKGLLRTAAKGLLPDEVLWRKKSPYPKTHNPAYLNAVSKMLAEIINEPSSPLLRIADKHELANLIALAPDIKWYGQLMNSPQIIAYFIQINHWLDKFKIRIV